MERFLLIFLISFCLLCYPHSSFAKNTSKKIEELIDVIRVISFLEFGFGISPDPVYYSPEMMAWQKKPWRDMPNLNIGWVKKFIKIPMARTVIQKLCDGYKWRQAKGISMQNAALPR